jgi:hypothetical protein
MTEKRRTKPIDRLQVLFDELLVANKVPDFLQPEHQQVDAALKSKCDQMMNAVLSGDKERLHFVTAQPSSIGLDRSKSTSSASVPELDEARCRQTRKRRDELRRRNGLHPGNDGGPAGTSR